MGSSAGGGLVLGILGWGVPPGSPNPDSISDQKMLFFTPVFRPGLYEIMLSLHRFVHQQNRLLKIHFEFAYFPFLSYSFGIKTINRFIHSKTIAQFQTKVGKVHTSFQTEMAEKPYPFGAAHTYMAYMREYPPPLRGTALASQNFYTDPKDQSTFL